MLRYFAKQAYAATDGGQVAICRAHPGVGGVVHSYEEALNTLDLAARMHLNDPVLHAADLLVYPVLTRDRQAMADLVRTVLGPLQQARGGAQPLIDTLTAYFDTGCVAAEAARRLSLSVRAMTYRLDRIHRLTGSDPGDPVHRYTLQTAVIGARLLGWPEEGVEGWGVRCGVGWGWGGFVGVRGDGRPSVYATGARAGATPRARGRPTLVRQQRRVDRTNPAVAEAHSVGAGSTGAERRGVPGATSTAPADRARAGRCRPVSVGTDPQFLQCCRFAAAANAGATGEGHNMGVSLAKGGNVSLSKEAPGRTAVVVGLGWDVRTTTGTDYDLDASALLCDDSGKVASDRHFVFYSNLTSPDGSVEHTGDNLTGEGDGDDEAVKVNLAGVPAEITKIVFPVSIHDAAARGQSFGQVRTPSSASSTRPTAWSWPATT